MLPDYPARLVLNRGRSVLGHWALAVVWLLGAAQLALATEAPAGLDLEQGEILGRTALAFVALDESQDRALPAQNLIEVHLVPVDSPTEELVFPGGEWILPPAGEYRFWLEGAGRISRAHGIVGYSASPFRGRGRIAARPTVPAGIVALAPDQVLAEGEDLRLLHTSSHNSGDSPQPEMSRRVRGSQAYDGVLMPAGPVIAGIHGGESGGGYAMISRPVEVVAGETVRLSLQPPAKGSDVVAVLDRPRTAQSFDDYDIEAILTLPGGEERPPDVAVPTAERLIAIWYGVEGRLATLGVRSSSLHLAPQDIALRARKVETIRGALTPLPALQVEVSLPTGFPIPEDSTIQVMRERTNALVASREVGPEDLEVAFPAVPAERLKVAASLPPFRQTEVIDLSDGADGELVMAMQTVRISGTVYRGDEPWPAQLEFGFWSGPKYRTTLETDAEGRYQGVFLRPPYAVVVRLQGREEAPYAQIVADEEYSEETRLDLFVPGNEFEVKVVDAESGRGIGGATVAIQNIWGKTPEGHELSGVRTVETSEAGRAELPPQRPGEVRIYAEADGYRRSESLELAVDKDDMGREITLSLVREGEGEEILVLLPNGAPAAGAEALLAASLAGDGAPLWRGQADSTGKLKPPVQGGSGWLLLKHPGASFLSRRWPDASSEQTFALPQAARPLALRAVRSWGDPAPWARLSLNVNGVSLSGAALQWVTGSSAFDAAALWQGSGLPAAPIGAVAWVPAEDVPRDPAALLASFATRIPYPWSGTVEIEAVE